MDISQKRFSNLFCIQRHCVRYSSFDLVVTPHFIDLLQERSTLLCKLNKVINMSEYLNPEEQSYLDRIYSHLVEFPESVYKELKPKKPNPNNFDRHNPEHICSGAYYGFDIYPPSYKSFRRTVKNLMTKEKLECQLSVEYQELNVLVNELYCFGIDVKNSHIDKENGLLIDIPLYEHYQATKAEIKKLEKVLSTCKGKKEPSIQSIENYAAKDFGFDSRKNMIQFYDELDAHSKEVKIKSYQVLCDSKGYIELLKRKGQLKENEDPIEALKCHPAYIIDAYLMIKIGMFKNLRLECYKGAIILMEVVEGRVKVHPPSYAHKSKKGEGCYPKNFKIITTQKDKDEIKDRALKYFGLNSIDMPDFHLIEVMV